MTDPDFFAAVAVGIPPITPPAGLIARDKPRPDMSLMRNAMGLPPEPESGLSQLFAQIAPPSDPLTTNAAKEQSNG